LLHWLFGYVYRNRGDLVRATESFAEAVRLTKAAGDLWHTMVAMTDLGIAYSQRGQLHKAGDIFREIFQHAARGGIRNHGYLGRVESHLSLVLLEQNILDQALQHARKGVELTQEWQSSNHMAWASAVLARVLMAYGDLQGAARALQEAEQGRTSASVLPAVDSFVEASRVRNWLNQGKLAAAERWADDLRKALGDDLCPGQIADGSMTVKLIALARILIARGRETSEPALFDEALALLDGLHEAALQGEHLQAAIETGTLQSVGLSLRGTLMTPSPSKSGKAAAALVTLERILASAEPEGYVRMFVDEGQPMAQLLYQAAAQGINPEYCGRLLAAFPEASRVRRDYHTPTEELIEPLSDREVEVLTLIDQGLTNSEVGQRLYLSLNTVKGHTRNIYTKLGVNSRTQAIARAKGLGILPSP
jgi:LuxR family transcriptional regulator, maltose regulon positive regulatory protein